MVKIQKISEIEISVSKLKELKQWTDRNYCLKAVEENGDALQYFEMSFISMLKVKDEKTKNCCDSCGQELP